MSGSRRRASSWRRGVAGAVIAAFVAVAGCSNTGATVAPGGPTPTPSRSPAAGGGGQAQGTPEGSVAIQALDLDVEGTIAGKQVTGKLIYTSFTIACNGAGPDQILVVHWIGTSPAGPALNGTIDFKPGTWDMADQKAQGSATIGTISGKPGDSLVGTAGTVTTQPSGGSIKNGVFGQGSGQVTVNGSWTCPSP